MDGVRGEPGVWVGCGGQKGCGGQPGAQVGFRGRPGHRWGAGGIRGTAGGRPGHRRGAGGRPGHSWGSGGVRGTAGVWGASGAQLGCRAAGIQPHLPWTRLPRPWNPSADGQIPGEGTRGSAGRSLFVCLLSAISLKVGCGRRGGSGGGREAARGGEDGGGRSGRSRCKNDSVSSAAARPLRLRCQRPGMYSSPLCLTQVRTPRPPGPGPHPDSTWNRNFADWNLPSAAGVGNKKGARPPYPPPSRPGCSWHGPAVQAAPEIGDPSRVSLAAHLEPRVLDPRFDLNWLTVLGTLPSLPSWLDAWGELVSSPQPSPFAPGKPGVLSRWRNRVGVGRKPPTHPWGRSWGSLRHRRSPWLWGNGTPRLLFTGPQFPRCPPPTGRAPLHFRPTCARGGGAHEVGARGGRGGLARVRRGSPPFPGSAPPQLRIDS